VTKHGSAGRQLANQQGGGSEEWNVAECLRILFLRKTTVLWITGMAVLGAALITAGQPRLYQARASLEIQAFNDNFLNLRDVFPAASLSTDTGPYIQTQTELLQQDAVLQAVARKLHVERRPEFQPASKSLGKLRKAIGIVAVRNSRIIQIVAAARDPGFAAELANTVADTFIEQGIEGRQRAARQTYESLRPQLDEARHELAPQEARAGVGSGPGRRRDLPTGEGDAKRRYYEALLQKTNDARMASVVRQTNIRLAGPAEPPSRPYKPNLPLNLTIGALGGLVLAIGYVMLREQNTSRLHAPGEAGSYLAVPELGAIPNDGAWKPTVAGLLHPRSGRYPIERVVLERQTSRLSESFRCALASILSAAGTGDQPRILVISSSRASEGKTTVVSNLGIALAETGSKVLLIDGDLRRPKLHQVFDLANAWGLSDILRERDSIDSLPLAVLVKPTAVPHLSLLPGGASTEQGFSLLHSGRLSQLLPRFREQFDYVLVDAPPCLEFADARKMARCADGLVLVVRANFTDRRTAQAAVQRLECDGIRVTGVILNRWDSSRSDLYGYPAFGDLGRLGIS
jgi:receptor protein-tyrosine kinase